MGSKAPADGSTTKDTNIRQRPARAKQARSKELPRKQMTWTHAKRFTSGFYFANLDCDSVDLTFEVEGTEPVWISDLSVHACPDVLYREFEHGVVLANPAPHPYTLDLGSILPGQRFRRIVGTVAQDPETNNGGLVGETLTLAGRDALFLSRVEEPP